MTTRRGDLAVIERTRTDYARTGRTETTEYAVMLVSNVTRDGAAKAVKDIRWGDDVHTQRLDQMLGLRKILIVSKGEIDVPAAIATVRTHTYPNSTTPRDYESLDDVRAALAPHRITADA
jgi:hypothetical protein